MCLDLEKKTALSNKFTASKGVSYILLCACSSQTSPSPKPNSISSTESADNAGHLLQCATCVRKDNWGHLITLTLSSCVKTDLVKMGLRK